MYSFFEAHLLFSCLSFTADTKEHFALYFGAFSVFCSI